MGRRGEGELRNGVAGNARTTNFSKYKVTRDCFIMRKCPSARGTFAKRRYISLLWRDLKIRKREFKLTAVKCTLLCTVVREAFELFRLRGRGWRVYRAYRFKSAGDPLVGYFKCEQHLPVTAPAATPKIRTVELCHKIFKQLYGCRHAIIWQRANGKGIVEPSHKMPSLKIFCAF